MYLFLGIYLAPYIGVYNRLHLSLVMKIEKSRNVYQQLMLWEAKEREAESGPIGS